MRGGWPVTGAEERLGRALVRALLGLEFDARMIEGRRARAQVLDGLGGPYVAVSHPDVRAHLRATDDERLLLARVSIAGGKPRLDYAVPLYAAAVRQVVERVGSRR